MDPPQRLARLHRAVTLLESGESSHAAGICRELLPCDDDDVEALLLLGLAIGMQGNADAAAPILNRVAAARSGYAHPCSDLARMLVTQGRPDLVEPQFRACLATTPDDVRLRYGLAEFLRERDEGAAAVELITPVVLVHPASAEAHDQMGLSLAEAGRFAEAAGEFRGAIACDPAPAVFWANLGMMLKVERQFDASLAAYAEALARAPDNRQIRVNRAVARLHAGRFAEAWQDEDWVLAEPGRALTAEQWLPPLSRVPDLSKHTVLVVQEEGLGDTLQFLRYLPLLAARGARVIVAVPPALVRLLRTVPGVADVPDGAAPVPRYDFHCSFNGLPRAFETTLETLPAPGALYRSGQRSCPAMGRTAAGGWFVASRSVLGRTGAALAGRIRRARQTAQHESGDAGADRGCAPRAIRQPAEGTGEQ